MQKWFKITLKKANIGQNQNFCPAKNFQKSIFTIQQCQNQTFWQFWEPDITLNLPFERFILTKIEISKFHKSQKTRFWQFWEPEMHRILIFVPQNWPKMNFSHS